MTVSIKTIPVDDQERACAFYTEKLGFLVKQDIPYGGRRWITLVTPDDPDGVEIGLEPSGHPAFKAYQQALKADGIPCTALAVDDISAEHLRLASQGVYFPLPPTDAGDVKIAVLDDTCGNLVQLVEA